MNAGIILNTERFPAAEYIIRLGKGVKHKILVRLTYVQSTCVEELRPREYARVRFTAATIQTKALAP